MSLSKPIVIIGAIIALSLVLAVSGCTGSQSVTSTQTPVATPTTTPTDVPTPTPTPTPAATPAATPTATPTATPVPTVFAPTQSPTSSYSWPGYDFHWSIPYRGPVLLTINGLADNPLSLTLEDLKAYPQYTITMLINHTLTTGTGPSFSDLINSSLPRTGTNALNLYYNGTNRSVELDYFYDSQSNDILAIRSDNTLEVFETGGNIDDEERIINVNRFSIECYEIIYD